MFVAERDDNETSFRSVGWGFASFLSTMFLFNFVRPHHLSPRPMDLYRASIHYLADSYEIYEDGKRLDAGVCNVDIRGIAKQSEIKFVLTGAESFPLTSVFVLPFSSPEADLLPDRIQYFKMFAPRGNEPMLCHIFLKGEEIDFIRFAIMGMKGFKLFEFKGRLLEDDNIEDISLRVKSAETIIRELRRSGSLNPDRLLEWGVEIYNANCEFKTEDNIRALIEAFKLFIEADKRERRRMDEEQESSSLALPVILKLIALCNYKLGNLTQAGKVAECGLQELEIAQEESVLSFDPNTLGKNTLEEIVDLVQKAGKYEPLEEDDFSFNETEMDLDVVEGLLLFMEDDDSGAEDISAENLRSLLKRISYCGDVLVGAMNDNDSAINIIRILDTTRNTLYYCWEKLGFGRHSDFWKEGESEMSYMFIELGPQKYVQNLLNFYMQSSPFHSIDRKDIIRRGVIAFCKETLRRL